ncbi:MAG TPA: NYN domain-containing protein [Actinomycetota bacterium]|nr:NYN domain-containing protein [Actinomycetota bacterium]
MEMRWIVDAMNVIGSRPDGWWNDRDRAIRDFVAEVDAHAQATGKDITVVLDKDPGGRPETPGIEVVAARRRGRNAADHAIEQIVLGEEDRSRLIVVTSDRALREAVEAAGAKVTSAGSFRRDMDGVDP